MKKFRDFINAHPVDDDCSGCEQPSSWPWLINLRFLKMLRERVNDLEITELQELIDLAGETGENSALRRDCPIIWDQFISWRRQQEKMQQLGINYELINRPVVGE